MIEEARARLVTVRDTLRYAVSRFNAAGLSYGHGTQDAFDEAAYLILHTLHLPLDRLDPFLDARLTATEMDAVLDIVERRVQLRVPAPYLTGEAWLNGYRFRVDERVIVPRSLLAAMIKDGLAPWIENPTAIWRVLDLCTGSGCLAIIAAEAFPNANVDAIDVSPQALEVAALNVKDYGMESRVRLIASDLAAKVAHERYDVIVTNPPYVNSKSISALPQEFLREPALALNGGPDGMAVVRRILAQAREILAEHGVLVMEIGHEREHFEAAFPDLTPTWLETGEAEGAVLLVHREDLP